MGVSSVTASYFIIYVSSLQNATAVLLQNATEVYYKMRQVFYYKVRQLLQISTILLQNTKFIYKSRQYIPYRGKPRRGKLFVTWKIFRHFTPTKVYPSFI